MRGEWIRRSEAGTSVVFVHGILSSGETCWRHENGSYWPELLKNEAALGSLGIYVFTYETGIFSGSYCLSDIVDALKEHTQVDKVLKSERLIFVCHSMGGIVVRKFLVERASDLIEEEKEIGLFLVASPSLGSDYANWLKPLAQLFGNAQADALRFVQGNYWLNDLDRQFSNLKDAGKLRMKGKELIEDKFVVLEKLWQTQVVEPFSGRRYFGESFKVPMSNHFSIAKPENKDAIQHRLLCRFIEDGVVPKPKIYISYTWLNEKNDKGEWKRVPDKRAFELAERLRKNGFDSRLDIYSKDSHHGFEPPHRNPGDRRDPWIIWAEEQIRDADCVLLICIPEYVASDPDSGESTGEWWSWHLLNDNSKFNKEGLPVMRENRRPALWWDWHCIAKTLEAKPEKFIPVGFGYYNSQNVPAFVRGATYYDVESMNEFEGLCRRIKSECQKPHSQ
ncbi:MAG: alpha/beta fold hydrolase [Nitrospira sp.]|nr:alpha/beta fold hydrolase [Nitrospira sp.]